MGMKIERYCLVRGSREFLPAIPIGVVSSGKLFDRDFQALGDNGLEQIVLRSPMEVPARHWLGVELDGSCTLIKPDEETVWRMTRATKALEELHENMKQKGQSMKSVHLLHAASNLAGIRIAELFRAVSSEKSADETIEQVVARLMKH